MTMSNAVAKLQITRSAAALVLAALASLAGCAQNADTRLSWERRNTLQDMNRFAYLDCVSKRANSSTSTITFDQTSGQLLVGSNDPQKASGRVDVSEHNGNLQFSVYQAHAWQTKGDLVNAATTCARS
ncbi:hypothetical protein [Pseudomonas segetis]|uniref:Lipoprotein n=1 Tax=Pseudomonas segetis TaxID=298908 RepID=A0A239JKB7_9PSED|nr:hypothetical protein [Pseudomonas segetis]SNT06275.1 hypothetical protein SAMN05216255_4382 [Pseudomonas segetis]